VSRPSLFSDRSSLDSGETRRAIVLAQNGTKVEGPVQKPISYVACATVAGLAVACSIIPNDERPGFRLPGEVHPSAVASWEFTKDSGEIFIETVTPYWIPHSVTAWCVMVGDDLYVSADDADQKRWVANVARNPNVRLWIKGKVYEQKLVPVTDPTTIASIDSGFVRKYEYEEEDYEDDEEMVVGYWRVVERD
jgi:hypothetical protein